MAKYSGAPWRMNAGTFAPRNFRSRERKFHGTFAPWNFRSLELPLTWAKKWVFKFRYKREKLWQLQTLYGKQFRVDGAATENTRFVRRLCVLWITRAAAWLLAAVLERRLDIVGAAANVYTDLRETSQWCGVEVSVTSHRWMHVFTATNWLNTCTK